MNLHWSQGVDYYLPVELRVKALARYLNTTQERIGRMSMAEFLEYEAAMLFVGTMQ